MPAKRVIRRRPAPLLPPQPLPPPAPVPVPAAPITLPRPEGAWRVLAYILALFQPALGLVLALLYWKADLQPIRRFSRVCLALALLGLVFSGCGDFFETESLGSDRFIQPY